MPIVGITSAVFAITAISSLNPSLFPRLCGGRHSVSIITKDIKRQVLERMVIAAFEDVMANNGSIFDGYLSAVNCYLKSNIGYINTRPYITGRHPSGDPARERVIEIILNHRRKILWP
jgi:hypothetical protein